MMVVLVPASDSQPSLQPATVSELARLGVTSIAILHDARTVGLVVEGWAFDAERSADAVVEAIAGGNSRAQTLLPLVEMAVSTAEGGGRS